MAKRSRKLTPKTSKENQQNQPRTGVRKRVLKKTLQKPKPGSWLSSTLASAILLSSAGIIISFAWISFLFIMNPDQVSWLNKILPEWAKIPLGKHERPQTFKNIELDLSKKNLIVGELLPLDRGTKNSFFMPVFQQRVNCESDCQKLVEIRVYQRSQELEFKSEPENYYYLESQLPITGPEESFVISSLADVTLEPQDISVPLPLTKVQRFEGQTPSPGVWFNLQGERQQGISALAYGHIVYYNPERSNLQLMLSWMSPSGQLPKWQQVTGDATKELVIDRTLGLEPRLEVYQVKPLKLFLKPIQLEAINLKSPILKDSGYQNALSIARTGLWTPAFEWLKFIKKQRKGLPQEAQAQMDLIRLHSQLTKSQAEKSWASPGEQVLANLIDGRWGKALQVFESADNLQEIATLLKGDEKRLWNRTVAALRVNPNRQEVQAWFALILGVQRGQEAANSWLETQPQITKDRLAYIQGLLAKLDGEVAKSQISHPSQIVGTVQPMAEVISSEWLQPNSTADLKLTDNQVWYQVQVSAFSDGKRWLNFPFENLNPPKTFPATFFWKTLGINSDPQMQIVVWLPNGEQQITIATIKAVQLRNKVLRLLVAAPKIPENQNNVLQPKPLALTNAALEWVQPFPITLRELHAQNPSAVKVILSSVWESLQKSGEVPAGAIPSFEQMQDKLGDWPVQTIDLTNNGQPEIVLTISGTTIASLNQPQSRTIEENTNQPPDRTIILSDSDEVIYTDFQQNSFQKLSAIAKLSGVQSLALLVENAEKYSLKRWSDKNQRFE